MSKVFLDLDRVESILTMRSTELLRDRLRLRIAWNLNSKPLTLTVEREPKSSCADRDRLFPGNRTRLARRASRRNQSRKSCTTDSGDLCRLRRRQPYPHRARREQRDKVVVVFRGSGDLQLRSACRIPENPWENPRRVCGYITPSARPCRIACERLRINAMLSEPAVRG